MNATATITAPASAKCLCGCSAPVERTYRPGHDARHVSVLLAAIVNGQTNLETAQHDLPSAALRTKLQRAVDNAAAKAQARAERKAARQATKQQAAEVETFQHGEVKKGRWTYEATRGAKGIVQYLKRDGNWEQADAKTAATFQAR